MVSSFAFIWSLLPAALISALHVSLNEQEFFKSSLEAHSGSAVLRRFAVDKLHKREISALLHEAEVNGIDIWQVTPSHIDLFIPSHQESPLFLDNEIPFTDSILPPPFLFSSNSSSHRPGSWNLTSLANSTFHEGYHPLLEIDRFVEDLVELHPELVKLVNVGHSAEGREMFALEISKDKGLHRRSTDPEENTESAKKVGFLVTGAQHAREWIAVSTAMYLTHALVADPSEPHSLAALLNHFDFHIVLAPNPDGYIYTWERDRFWYKNRQIVGPNEKCIGLDMNRNWGHKWKRTARFPFKAAEDLKKQKKPQLPTDPCSHWYPGHRPFESPEVNNIANYVTTLPNLQLYVDLRSYGQMLSAPFSYSCKRYPKDAEDQIEAAMGAARAIKESHGTVFTTGTLCELLYRAPGNVVDYMYAKAGIKYSYAAHLRDTGTYGFMLPPEWIRPVGEETVNMIKSLAEFVDLRR